MICRKLLQLLVLAALLLFSQLSFAQDRVVNGKVTDSTGNGISGVSVTARGTRIATQTNNEGAFKLTVPNSVDALIFSSVGFTTLQMPIPASGAMNVSLSGAVSSLNEVVIIGYGTVRKKDLTGSVTNVSAKDFQKGNITTPEQLIAGKVAGVSIISNGGQPGSGSTIRIRGGSSLIASNDPLIVIDGVPLDNGSISGGNNPLSFINPNDIESFTVLKDASASAIYGTRAANGVIIITTKKGRSGNLRVNFTSTNSVSKLIKEVPVLNGDQVRQIVNTLGNSTQKSQVGSTNTNWQDQIYQTAFASDNNISFTGGISNLPYRVSIGYLNQTGILKTDNLMKNSAAFVLNPVLFDNHLKIDINLKGSIEKYRFASQGAIGTAVFFDPTQPVYSGNKRYNGYFEWLRPDGTPNTLAARNPLEQITDRHDNSNAQRSIGNIQFDYKFHFLPDLHANLNLGYDVSKGTGTVFISDSSGLSYSNHGQNTHYKQTKQNTVLEFYLNYVKDIKSIKSRIDVMAGYSYNDYLTTNYSFAGLNARGDTVSRPNFPFDKPENILISFFGRANYSYNDKYLVTATIRRDGSSRFSPNNRWALFPSVAVAWKLKDEAFLKNNKVVSDLKLRLGYGITGQQDGIGNYDYLSYYALSATTSSYQFGNVYYQGYRPGGFYANRKWEESATTNIAIDYGFVDNRINGSIDFYVKKTSKLLNNVAPPAGTNFAAFVTSNVGDMENKGVEFTINLQPVRNRNITWDVSFNATYNRNKITNLTIIPNDPNYAGFPSTNVAGVQGFAFLNAVGTSKNTFYLYHQIYDKSGSPIEGLVEDANRDGIINDKDKYKGKRADPNFFLGFSTNISYHKWNAGFVTRASLNNYLYNNVFSNNGRLNQILGAQSTGNASANYLVTKFTGGTTNADAQILSDYYLENASFLKMDNAYIGYNFGKIIQDRASLRLNASVQNAFVITKYKGLDPEISGGVDNNIYPRPRIYSLGINLDF
jgi:TonB-linked SusC/RagA family outer membrane protein